MLDFLYHFRIESTNHVCKQYPWYEKEIATHRSHFGEFSRSGGMMAGAIVLTLITSLLTTMQMPDSVPRMVLGGTLLILISIYGRQLSLRQ